MKVKIDGKSYDFVVRGTVGLTFLVEQMTDEVFDLSNRKHIMYLVFVILKTSNEGNDEITIDWLLTRMTSKMLLDCSSYISKRWIELEGENKSQDKPTSKKKD